MLVTIAVMTCHCHSFLFDTFIDDFDLEGPELIHPPFHASIRWTDVHDKTLLPFAMSHAVHLHNQMPRRLDKFAPVEIWSQDRSIHSQLINAHPQGVPVYGLDHRLQDGFKIPKFDPRARKGICLVHQHFMLALLR